MKRTIVLTILLTCLISSPAWAHASHDTADEGDPGTNIQVYSAYTWGGALADSMHTWNHLHRLYGHGPRFVRVSDRSRAEIVVVPTTYNAGNYFYVSPSVGPDIMWINRSSLPVEKYDLHELGHGLGLDDHKSCDGILTIMSYCYWPQIKAELYAHDKRYYRGL